MKPYNCAEIGLHIMTMKCRTEDNIVKLNTAENRRFIQYIILNLTDKTIKLSDIRIDDKENMTYILNKKVLCYDRHHHYPKVKDHFIATYYWRRSIQDLLENTSMWRDFLFVNL